MLYSQEQENVPFVALDKQNTRPIFFLRSSRLRVDQLSYETKKQEQCDWMAKKN